VTIGLLDDAALMQRALSIAREALSQGAMPIGAVLAREGEVLAEWFSRGTELGPLGHPESLVLREADRRLDFAGRREATLYTPLEPCLMCMGTACRSFWAVSSTPCPHALTAHRVSPIPGLRPQDTRRQLERTRCHWWRAACVKPTLAG
jgi:pyrimidine deaminase RibD-like protein